MRHTHFRLASRYYNLGLVCWRYISSRLIEKLGPEAFNFLRKVNDRRVKTAKSSNVMNSLKASINMTLMRVARRSMFERFSLSEKEEYESLKESYKMMKYCFN